MAEVAIASTADGIAKRKHTKIEKILPDKRLVLTDAVKYDQDREFGGELEAVAYLTHEHGFTYVDSTGAATDLNPSVVAESKPARLNATSVHLTTRITHELLSAASAKGDKAYERYMDGAMLRMRKAFDIREEVRRAYGGLSIAQINATASDGGTTITFVIKESSYAPMIWWGAKGMMLDAYKDDGTKLNTDDTLSVTSFDPATRTVIASGDATDIDAIVAATTDVYFYYRGAFESDGTGLVAIASLTAASDPYLGIDPADFPDMWTATQQTWDYSSTNLSWDLLNTGVEKAIGRGMDGDILLFPSMRGWRQLCSNMEALRVLDASYSASRSEFGHEIDKVRYHAVNGAVVTVRPSAVIKTSHCLGFVSPDDMNEICMAGSSQPKFGVPGEGNDAPIVTQIPRTNYVELNMFARQSVWAPCPKNFLLFAP